ncbi:MAG TPA: hypothetical protein VLG50_02205 [Candidatus Saccharimonadales bacterium]|nr:hypothetical protein [Candidatus Saccharimonadales bacterium]
MFLSNNQLGVLPPEIGQLRWLVFGSQITDCIAAGNGSD